MNLRGARHQLSKGTSRGTCRAETRQRHTSRTQRKGEIGDSARFPPIPARNDKGDDDANPSLDGSRDTPSGLAESTIIPAQDIMLFCARGEQCRLYRSHATRHESIYDVVVQQATIGDERNSKSRSPQPVHKFTEVSTQERLASAELNMIASGPFYEPGDPSRQLRR